jgi:predicted chitinase
MISESQFSSLFENLSAARASAMYPYFVASLSTASIDTCHELAAFVAQVGHESNGLLYFEELASGEAYEGRTDLGNTQTGDGVRFKGRGAIQLTGRTNYQNAGSSLSLDLTSTPELVCFPSAGFKTTAWFWSSNNLNQYCTGSSDDFITLTKRIKGGENGLADRQNRWQAAKTALGCGTEAEEGATDPPVETSPAPVAVAGAAATLIAAALL